MISKTATSLLALALAGRSVIGGIAGLPAFVAGMRNRKRNHKRNQQGNNKRNNTRKHKRDHKRNHKGNCNQHQNRNPHKQAETMAIRILEWTPEEFIPP